MSSEAIRWLHLSDFHVGKENYFPKLSMFKSIHEEVRRRVNSGPMPDFIFITGDIANKGKDSEYVTFVNDFLFPLWNILGKDWNGRTYCVPGNHDVDRDVHKVAWRYNVLDDLPNFLDPDAAGLAERKLLLPRFQAFQQLDLSIDSKWIDSVEGAFTDTVDIRGVTVGILGLNTAWLSGDKEEKEKLTPGVGMVREGLEKIKEAQFKIVLGHHPINWFRHDDATISRSLFGKHQAIYLHGHLHEISTGVEEGAGHLFRAIQSGASFMVRPKIDEIKKNRILWCECAPEVKGIFAEPLNWSEKDQEWNIDTEGFPPRFMVEGGWKYLLPLYPSDSSASPAKVEAPPGPSPGWIVIDGPFLAERRKKLPLDQEEVLGFFDGRIPSWEHALSPDIPKRTIVNDLIKDFNLIHEKKGPPTIHLLLGPGAEGKSTILRQTVCGLVDSGSWEVLWHQEADARLPRDFAAHIPSTDKSWLIASDDADLISQNLFEVAKASSEKGRKDLHFFLCSRETDWIAAKGRQLPWTKYAKLTERRVRGLEHDDAVAVVKAWKVWGDNGLGKLAGLDLEAAVAKLLAEAASEVYPMEGAFLGAMLRVRFGEDLKARVHDLLYRLNERAALGGTLQKAFAYIVALHAENVLILTKPVLAKALRCDPGDLVKRVIGPLGGEAAITPSGQYILARHRSIAEAARDILKESFHEDFDEIYLDLVRAAWELRVLGEYVPHLDSYADLSSHFFGQGQEELGIRLAKAQVEANPWNPFLLSRLSTLYRDAGQPDLSVKVFREAPRTTKRDRGLYSEWATAEGIAGSSALSAWLGGVSMADGTEPSTPNNERVVKVFGNFLVNYGELFRKYNDQTFLEALGACAQLCLKLPYDSHLKRILSKYQESFNLIEVLPVNDNLALERVIRGILKAWTLKEADLPDYVPEPETLKFTGLKYLLRLKGGQFEGLTFEKAKLISRPEV